MVPDSEFGLSPPCSPDISFHAERTQRLESLIECRGWKYFFKHVVVVPVAFTSGLALGVVIMAAVMLAMAPSMAASPQASSTLPYAMAMPPTSVPESYFMSPALNNSCLIPELAIPPGPQTFDACGFVVRATDELWNLRGDVNAAIEQYFHEDYLDAGSWGRRIVGLDALREAVLSQMRAFPDIRIHITDCVCQGNDDHGYKCAMPDVLTGTNLGPSVYGPPTGRFARWTGMVQSLVKRNPVTGRWQFYAEWGVHDEWALIQQLGLDFDRVPHPATNCEPLHDCTPLLRFGPEPTMDRTDIAAQEVERRATFRRGASR